MKILKGKVDMHIHSTASDGSFTPEEIMNIAKISGVSLISITDHDEVSNVQEAKTQALKQNIPFLTGVEISSTYKDEAFHILAYGIDIKNSNLISLINRNKHLLEEKDTLAIKVLIDRGFNISFEEYEKYENNPRRGGWPALNFLIDKGICSDVHDFFSRLFVKEYSLGFPNFPHPEKVIDIIKNSGGIPILAHPYYSRCEEDVPKRLGKFLEMGIEGVECFHPNHSKEISLECFDWCAKNNLITTCGSDCHGDFIKTRKIALPSVDVEQLNLGKLLYLVC